MIDCSTVHVVDDDNAVRISLRALLSAFGFSVESFASSEEFLALQHSLSPGVVIVDWRMPGSGGAGVLQHLADGFLPIVHSAYLDDATVSEARKLGAIDAIEKPCDPSTLIGAVRKAFAVGS
jgi:two-component system, LuxR family, response regulator FixJ